MTWLGYRRLRARSVIVTTKDDRSFRGALVSRMGSLVTLKSAELLQPGAQGVPMQGDVVIERSNISFIQVLS